MHKWLAIFSTDSRTGEFYEDRFIDEVRFAIEGHMLVVLWRCRADKVQSLETHVFDANCCTFDPGSFEGVNQCVTKIQAGSQGKLDSERRAFDRINPHRVCFARMLEETNLSIHGRSRLDEIASALLLHHFIHQSIAKYSKLQRDHQDGSKSHRGNPRHQSDDPDAYQ